jgi:hypothetical protein
MKNFLREAKMRSIARVVFASAALLLLFVAPVLAQGRGGGGFHGGMGGGFHGGMMGGGFHGGMMGGGFHGRMMAGGFHDGHFHNNHFHDGHFHGHGFFPWWGIAPFAYGAAYPYPYPAYPYPYYAGYSYASPGYY